MADQENIDVLGENADSVRNDGASSEEAAVTTPLELAEEDTVDSSSNEPAGSFESAQPADAPQPRVQPQTLPQPSETQSPEDAIRARRLAHGLSPEPTSEDIPAANSADLAAAKAEAAKRRHERDAAQIEQRLKKQMRQQRLHTIRNVIFIVLVLLLLGATILFCYFRWWAYDDAASIQGTWRQAGSNVTMEITDQKLILTDDVAYDYVIDPGSKTIAFTFGGLTGHARYRFSLDHQQLSIEDGNFDWFGTLVQDIPWTASAVAEMLTGQDQLSPDLGQSSRSLYRTNEPLAQAPNE